MQYWQTPVDPCTTMTRNSAAIRPARPADAPVLAALTVHAGHGVMDVFYAGLVPGLSTQEAVEQRRIRSAGNYAEWPRWMVAEDTAGAVLGGVNAFAHDVFGESPADPLIGPDRHAALASLSRLEDQARGTYYLNLIAVSPAARGKGIGSLLVAEAERQARAAQFGRLTLSTFESDEGLMRFYGGHGFRVLGTAPIMPHPALDHGGNWALLCKDLR
jgi:GNAT superfamily N-acetyltransferase